MFVLVYVSQSPCKGTQVMMIIFPEQMRIQLGPPHTLFLFLPFLEGVFIVSWYLPTFLEQASCLPACQVRVTSNTQNLSEGLQQGLTVHAFFPGIPLSTDPGLYVCLRSVPTYICVQFPKLVFCAIPLPFNDKL